MDREKQLIYLAALIHDIGKFYQRADEDGSRNSRKLSENVKKLESVLCPEWNSRYTHKHVLWTAQFIEDLTPHINKYLTPHEDIKPDTLLRTAAAHHNPTNYLEKLIQKADHYSSGADRSKDEDSWKDAVEEEDKKWDSFKRISMRSVFETVSLSDNKTVRYRYKLPVGELSLKKDDFFPKIEETMIPDYKNMWEKFYGEIKFIQSSTFKTFSETFLFLLEKYTSRIPSSTQHLPDVSLYDHAKTTAAFAACLYDYVKEKGYLQSETMPGKDEKPFLLIGGDFSGIQQFIYDIAARGAAKNLKGRSFYLQLLGDNIVRYLLDSLNLFDSNVIYSSGGGFYILAPNTEFIKTKIYDLEKNISKRLFEEHGTSIAVCLGYVPFGEEEIYYRDEKRSISDVWKDLSEKIGLKKSRKQHYLIEEDYNKLFTPQSVNTEKGKDFITGEELGNDIKYLDKEDKKQPVNYSTWKQIELGKKLKKTDYWIISKEKLTYFEDNFVIEPLGLGYYNYFLEKEAVDKAEEKLRKSADNVRVLYFNKGNFLDPIQKGIDNVYGFVWYGGNDFPINRFGEPKTFTELSGVEFTAPNYRDGEEERLSGPSLVRMGVLRMDVDNLGAIFRSGLPESRRSFSRYCTLSRSMDFFFKGYLNQIWNNDEDFRKYTQIIYSGGDDLFIVGKWDVLERMAVEINKTFRDWTCHNPDLTLSGGMAMVGPKFPILKAAESSDKFEKSAKSHIWKGIEKNSFSLFEYNAIDTNNEPHDVIFSFNWDAEYPVVKNLKDEIKYLMGGSNGLPTGFSGQVYNFLEQAGFSLNPATGKYTPQNYSVIWLIAYQFKRAMKQTSKSEVKSFLEQWVENTMTGKINRGDEQLDTKYHALQYLALASRWAALENRSKLTN